MTRTPADGPAPRARGRRGFAGSRPVMDDVARPAGATQHRTRAADRTRAEI